MHGDVLLSVVPSILASFSHHTALYRGPDPHMDAPSAAGDPRFRTEVRERVEFRTRRSHSSVETWFGQLSVSCDPLLSDRAAVVRARDLTGEYRGD